MSAVIPPREEIDKAYTWNAESVFASHDDWQAEFAAAGEALPAMEAFPGTLAQGPARLLEWLETSEKMSRRISRLYFYAVMHVQVNTGDEAAKMMQGQIGGLAARARAAGAFAEPELLAIGRERLQAWLGQEPRLATYAHYLDNLLRRTPHLRSAELEAVLALASEPFALVEQIASMLTDADMQFPDALDSDGGRLPVAQSSISTLLQNPDREVRRTAWEGYADAHLAFKNTLASTYVASVKENVFTTRVRRYDSALHAALFPHNIPVEVFHNLLSVFRQNLPTWQRYWEVRRRALGVEALRPYDIWAPLTREEPEVPYEQAVEWICEGMAPLGAEYVETLRRGCLEQRWVDIYPNQGKGQGAFSWGTYDTYPFIMMSYDNSLSGLSTLAHELGHSMHSYNSRRSQPYAYSGYSLFLAEVASNFNQAMVRAHLFATQDDPQFQLALIQEAMDNFHRYFFIMPTLARFELEVHTRAEAGKPLTADILNGIMSELYAEGYGSTMTDDPVRTGITWAQFGHLYTAYYTFQYATGISAAHALAEGILAGEAGAVERYLGFLKAGSSRYAMDVLDGAGVDMRGTAAVEKTFAVLGSLVDRLERLIS